MPEIEITVCREEPGDRLQERSVRRGQQGDSTSAAPMVPFRAWGHPDAAAAPLLGTLETSSKPEGCVPGDRLFINQLKLRFFTCFQSFVVCLYSASALDLSPTHF